MVRAATWLSLALAGLLGVANAAEVANTEDTPDERAQQLCSENVPCSDGYFCTPLGQCTPKFLSNAVCTEDYQCAGGSCLQIDNDDLDSGFKYCACFSHDQCNNDMPGKKKKYVCTPQNYCSACRKKGCYPESRFELGESCSENNDCQSGKCAANEDYVDVCSCSPVQPCEGGASCDVDLDCESGNCDDGRCKCFNHRKRKVRVGCTDEQLCTGSNTCEPLKLGGESCENNKECVGKCKKGVCQCSENVPCKDNFYCDGKKCEPQLDAEETCHDNIECKSGNCENYKCGCVADDEVECPIGQYCLENGSEEVTGQGVCSEKKDWWQFCDDDDECDSGKCREVGNKKRCKCQVDADCPNTSRFTCKRSTGTCLVRDGQKCIVNDDPAKNLLSDGRNVRCGTGACVDGVCGKGLGGATCVGADGAPDDTLCEKGICNPDDSDQNEHVCACELGEIACADETQYCDSTSECKQKVIGGEFCQLSSGTVDESVCQSDDCGNNNRCKCDGPGNCKDGMYCPQGGGGCTWSHSGGVDGCQNMDLAYCKSGLCVDNTCGCTAHSHCDDQFCAEDNTCKDKLVGGEDCDSGEQCESGTCSNDGVCECESDSFDCKDGQFCEGSVCQDHLFAGEACAEDDQCSSGTCDDNAMVCTCEGKDDCQNEDHICRTQGDYGTCGAPLDYNLSCGSDEECESGQCNDNGRCGCQNDLDCAGMNGEKACKTIRTGGDLTSGTCVDK